MKFEDVILIERGSSSSGDGRGGFEKVGLFGTSADNIHACIVSMSIRKLCNEIDRDSLPRARGSFSRIKLTNGLLSNQFGTDTGLTMASIFTNVARYLGPPVVP